jgi:MFS family permease
MDTTGAIIGPVLALIYLYYAPGHYTPLFYFAFFPGMLAILLLFVLREAPIPADKAKLPYSFSSFTRFWAQSSLQYKQLAGALLVFALFNSSDYFLLLRLRDHGFSDVQVIGFYVFYNVLYAVASYPLGGLADKFGARPVLCAGLVIFALVYAGMSLPGNSVLFAVLFFLYGLYAAATDGVSKAWISGICAKAEVGTALGTFTAFQSIGALFASILAGAIWSVWGFVPVFLSAAVISLVVAVYLFRAGRR